MKHEFEQYPSNLAKQITTKAKQILNRWKLRTKGFEWIKGAKCPCCGVGEFEFINDEKTGILVNAESKGRVYIEDFWIPTNVCNNPLCGWSKIDVEDLNMISTKNAWKHIENDI